MLFHFSDGGYWDMAISDDEVKEKLVTIIAKKYKILTDVVKDMLLDLMKKDLLIYSKLCDYFEKDILRAFRSKIKHEKYFWKCYEEKLKE